MVTSTPGTAFPTDPGTGRVCIRLPITGGYEPYIATWEPVDLTFDEETGLWCGKLTPCASASGG